MAFVNEEIPEAVKDAFTFPVEVAYGGRKPTLWKWTIDRERNAFLVLTKRYGGAYDGTVEIRFYVFSWNDFLIKFCANPLFGSALGGGRTIKLHIYDLFIPDEVVGKEDDIKGLIVEAFEVKGWLYSLDNVASIEVVFASSSAA